MKLLINFCFICSVLTQFCFSQWTWQNPLPQGNTLNCVKFISSTVGWAVGNGGTILKTTNGGTTWNAQTSGTVRDLNSITFIDANNGWAVGGIWLYPDSESIILKTTNGGTTWTPQVSSTILSLNGVSFTDINNGWAVGSVGVIIRTTNGGTTWTTQTSGTTNKLHCVYFSDTINGIASGWNGKILKTTDGGISWNQVNQLGGELQDISFADSNTGWVVGMYGKIYKTIDGGMSWAPQSSGITEDHLYSVYFNDVNNGWAVGGRSYLGNFIAIVLRTTNGGTTWTLKEIGTSKALYGVSFTDVNNGTVVGLGGTILKTTNGGTTWNTQTSSIATNELRSVSFTDANNVTTVGDGGTILRTTNGGTTWNTQISGTTNSLRGVSFTDANNGTAVGDGGTILRTTNGGTTWNTQISGTTNSLRGVSFTDANTGWLVGDGGTILKTTDGGTNWMQQTSGYTYSIIGVSFTDQNTGTAVGGYTILRTTNGGTTWTIQTSETRYPLNAVSFSDPNYGTAVGGRFYGPNICFILRTTDGGTTWMEQSSGTRDILNSVSFTNVDNGTAVGYKCIIRTTDGGATWTQQYGGDNNLFGVSIGNSNNGTAVGSIGTILRIESTTPHSMNLISPNGSENWQVEGTYDITWNYTNVSNVKIDYTTNNGTTWLPIIASTPSDGLYSWTIPNTPSTQCKVRISDVDNYPPAVDISDSLFTICYSQPVALLTPQENQTITTAAIDFEWSDVNALYYKIIVDNNSGLGSKEVFDSITTTTYTIPGYFLEANTYFWKVIAYYPGGATLESDTSYFHYDPPKLTDPYWTPLYRLYKPGDKDHFYCTTTQQRQAAVYVGYKDERVEGHISAKPFSDADMKCIFRLYHPVLQSHYYTADGDDKEIKIQNGYTYEGIIGYAYGSNKPELTPLYQLHKDFSSPTDIDHFYTCSFAERNNATKLFGYSYDSITAFISPNGNLQTRPVSPGQLETGLGVNTVNGNLRHYTKSSFNIPGKGLPLEFEHFYNSVSALLYSGITPLSPGWSHSYNSYVVTLNPDEVNQNVLVVWPNGDITEYKYNGTNYAPQTLGDYDIFNVIAAPSHFTVKKKDQTLYTFNTPANAQFGYPAMLTSISDRNNNTTTIKYDTLPIVRIKEVTDPSGRVLSFNYYNETGREYLIKEVIDNTGIRMVQFVYDALNRLIEYKDPEYRSTFYSYDTTWVQDHLLNKIILPKGNSIEYEYTAIDTIATRFVSKQTLQGQNAINLTPDGFSTHVAYPNAINVRFDHNENGSITNVYDEALFEGDKFWYQDSENPTKPTQVQDKKGNYSTFQYDLRGNVLQINQLAGVIITHKYEYDSKNNVTKYTDPRNKITTFSYDANGNLISTTDPRGTTTYSRNSFGKIESLINPLSHITNLGYNSFGNLVTITDPLSYTTTYSYDNSGRVIGILNAKNQNSSYSYDKSDLLLTESDALNHTTTNSYDANSYVTAILNARGFTTSFGYDDKDRLISKTEPNSNPTQYSYRENGQINSRTNPDGSIINYGYDPSGRVNSISSSDVNATIQYDLNGNIIGVNELGAYKGSAGSMSFSYDGIDRLTSYTDFYSKTVSYSYDESSNIKSVTYPGGKTVNYTYYDDNRLNSVTDWNGKTTTYLYRNDGSLQQVNYPNGVVTNYLYDIAERIIEINTNGPSGIISNYTFIIDALGNHTTENINQPLPVNPNHTNISINSSYDQANRIQSAGNINFVHDLNGNTIQKYGDGISFYYEYDVENRLTHVINLVDTSESVTYVYDIFGNRRAKIKSGYVVRYVLDINGPMSEVLMETDESGNPINYYIYGLGLVCRIKPDGTTRYYHDDFRGSIVAITDQNGLITHKYSYEPFGKVINKIEEDPNPFQYVGKCGVINENNGLYFMRARYYDPEIGRFISEDPIWKNNLFSYASNNPISFIDPRGENEITYNKETNANSTPIQIEMTAKQELVIYGMAASPLIIGATVWGLWQIAPTLIMSQQIIEEGRKLFTAIVEGFTGTNTGLDTGIYGLPNAFHEVTPVFKNAWNYTSWEIINSTPAIIK